MAFFSPLPLTAAPFGSARVVPRLRLTQRRTPGVRIRTPPRGSRSAVGRRWLDAVPGRQTRTNPVFGFGRSKAVVGLDIGSSAVKAVELKPVGKAFRVTAFAAEPIPPDSIVDGAIIDGGAVADAVRRLFEANKAFKSKDVAASLSGHSVIVRKISLPVMTETELAQSISWEAEQYIPFDIQDVNLDYQVLNPGTDGKGTMDVLLVAAKKDKIADYTGVISQVGRNAVVVDVDAFALQNAYEVNYADDPSAVIVLLNAGASSINVNVLSNNQSLFTRDISTGGNAYTEAVQKELGLAFDAAERAKKGEPVEGVSFDDVAPVLHAMNENVLLEIQKTFDFFKATATSDRIDRIILSGGAAVVDGFAASLGERLSVPVEFFNPFKTVSFDAQKLGAPEQVASMAAVAVGLALRKTGDR
ncbi:MAG: type IV pilus assembly protein PilM [Acidimicrobiia bacterium]|nr:type IV pilus assembly protein PilM [Acidimicrobiia bacterium]